MSRKLIIISLLVVCILAAVIGVQAAPPQREKQIVYGITPWNGKEYGGTFAPKGIDTMYLLADVDNVLNTLETEVYFWPITQEYMANWFESKKEIEGKLEILKDGEQLKVIERQPYVHVYPEGYWAGKSELVVGEEAKARHKEYQDAIDNYWKAVSEYREAQAEYEKKMDEILKEVQETGKKYKEEELPKAPEQPEPPKLYVTQPTEAFIVNLPPGQYTVRTIDKDGKVIEGTEKRLKVFKERRTGIGYQIIPESKWTRPVQSDDSSQILYLSGKRTMYLKAFNEAEYNQHDYLKMTSLEKPLAGKGGESSFMWVHTDEIEKPKLQVLQDGKVVQEIERKPYYVKQTPGYALGYDIVEFDPEKEEFQGRRPSFEAIKLELTPGSYQIRVVDENGKVLKGSVREIRSINAVAMWQLYLLAAIPFIIGLIVFAWRRRLRVSTKVAVETA